MLIRIFIDDALTSGAVLPLLGDKLHYVATVMRVENGQNINVFNGRDGEFKATVTYEKHHKAFLTINEKIKEPETPDDVWLLFAPVKRDCTDLIAEKASELGAAAIIPVITKRTIVSRVNTSRLSSISIEAAEQCRRVSLPEIHEPVSFAELLKNWDKSRALIFLDETGKGSPIADIVKETEDMPIAFLVGPEGGFAPEELETLRGLPFTLGVTLDHHILRAETACFTALAIRKYI